MAKKNCKFDRILWLDLEMTGLNPCDDMILEAAAIVTDWNFNEIASYKGVVHHNPWLMKLRMFLNRTFWNDNQDSKESLLKQNIDGRSSKNIEAELLKFIDRHFDKETPVLLGGNSVHMDRRFIACNWPTIENRLHYRMLDVSAWKVVFDNKYDKIFAKPDVHRALDDIRGSIMELKYYLASVNKKD